MSRLRISNHRNVDGSVYVRMEHPLPLGGSFTVQRAFSRIELESLSFRTLRFILNQQRHELKDYLLTMTGAA